MKEPANINEENGSHRSNDLMNNSKEKISDVLIWGATIFGVLAIAAAIYMPFFIKDRFLGTANYATYGDLGPIGDYLGGTTVAILTAASVFLLLATIIMQRKEIKISQEGIKQLVIQTEASVEQAEEARKEAIVTNETMARQQFETTFFNMIELHSNLSKNISYYGESGNKGIIQAFEFLNNRKNDFANKKYRHIFNEEMDYEEVKNLITQLQYVEYGLVEKVNLDNKKEVMRIFKKLDFEELLAININNSIVHNYKSYSRINIDEKVIQKSIEKFIQDNDNSPLRYFNSFSIIIEFLKNSQFEVKDKKTGQDNNKIYRKILFSQLSSEEMVLIYYLAKYTSSNEWLLDELRTYKIFYPNLVKSLLLFGETDAINIEALYI